MMIENTSNRKRELLIALDWNPLLFRGNVTFTTSMSIRITCEHVICHNIYSLERPKTLR